jgi:hypothetical protein
MGFWGFGVLGGIWEKRADFGDFGSAWGLELVF